MEQDRIFNSLEEVSDESSFIQFVNLLIADRQFADRAPLAIDGFRGEWANQTIADFLDAAVSWADGSDFGERPGPKPSNPWQAFALFLWAGRSYE